MTMHGFFLVSTREEYPLISFNTRTYMDFSWARGKPFNCLQHTYIGTVISFCAGLTMLSN